MTCWECSWCDSSAAAAAAVAAAAGHSFLLNDLRNLLLLLPPLKSARGSRCTSLPPAAVAAAAMLSPPALSDACPATAAAAASREAVGSRDAVLASSAVEWEEEWRGWEVERGRVCKRRQYECKKGYAWSLPLITQATTQCFTHPPDPAEWHSANHVFNHFHHSINSTNTTLGCIYLHPPPTPISHTLHSPCSSLLSCLCALSLTAGFRPDRRPSKPCTPPTLLAPAAAVEAAVEAAVASVGGLAMLLAAAAAGCAWVSRSTLISWSSA